MGALHQGHVSLMEKSKAECGYTVVSVFVNPRQFNNQSDLTYYPRPVEQDIRMVHDVHADLLFIPEEADIYPEHDPYAIHFDPGHLGEVMEGVFRPGHFQGVADVVYRLLRMVDPDRLYLGQKDFQQVAIIRKLIRDTSLLTEIMICPTLRESNGLALSSRNTRLSPEGKEDAALIYRELTRGKIKFEEGKDLKVIRAEAMESFKQKGFAPEYFEIVDGHTLLPLSSHDRSSYVVACCAVMVEGIRLIDNLIWKE
jgi:pantoate--beta-alanine ligase